MTSTPSGSATTRSAAATTTQHDDLAVYDDTPGVSGWIWFASTVLGLAGLMRIVDSIWAFRYHGAIPDNLQGGALGTSLKNYAWAWLAVGVVLIVSSFLLLVQSQFARWIGGIAAGIGALAALTWMPYYPVWSLTYVFMMVLVIYALSQHGARTRG